MNLHLDTLAYSNQLRRIPPEHKLQFAVGYMLIAFFSHGLVQFLIFLWVSLWVVARARIPSRIYIGLLSAPLLFLLMSLPALLVSVSPQPPLSNDVVIGGRFYSYFIYISQSNMDKAMELSIRSLSMISLLLFIILTIPFTELLYALKKIRMPLILTEIMLLIYRFIFVFLQMAGQLNTAQLARGGYHGFRNRLRDTGNLISQLFIKSMQQVQKLTVGLQARGFTGQLEVINTYTFIPSGKFIFAGVIGALFFILLELWIRGLFH